MAPGRITDHPALWRWPPNQLASAPHRRASQTFARRQTALVRLVERGPDGLARVKGTPFGRLAERRRSRP
jgi:hypothetical protein